MTKDKKTILFILPWLPYPLCSGGHQAIFNGIKAIKDDYNIIISYQKPFESTSADYTEKFIQELNGNITILPFDLPPEPTAKPLKLKTRIHRWLRGQNSLHNSSATPKPEYYEWPYHFWPMDKNYTQHILSIIKRYNIKIVQCEMIGNAPLVYTLPDNIIRIFVHHEILFVRHQLLMEHTCYDKTEMLSYVKNAMATEIGTLNFFDGVITLSQTDADKLLEAGVKSALYPSFAIVRSNNSHKLNTIIPTHNLSFVGPSSHNPNYLGIKWFLENCWQALCSQDYKLKIIGDWDNEVRNEISTKYSNVTFTGFVENLESELENSIMIVPIKIGSGIRMKILEAAAMGVPVISTTVGVEGLPLKNNEHCLIADTPDAFVESIKKMQDVKLCSSLAGNAKSVVADCYSLDALRSNRLKIYKELMERKYLKK